MLLFLIFGLVIGVVSVIFALQNVFPVTVTFMVWELSTSLAVIVILAILIGLMVGILISVPGIVRNIFIISNLQKENKKLSNELEIIHKADSQIFDTDTIEEVKL